MTATVLHSTHNAGLAGSAGVTAYCPVGVTFLAGNATEANRHAPWREAGSFSNLRARVSANAATAATVATLRVAGSNTALTVSFGAGATGLLEDTTHSASVTAGQNVSYGLANGAGGATTFQSISVDFAPTDTSKATVHLCATSSNGYATASAARYNAIVGVPSTSVTTESQVQIAARVPGTLRNLYVRVSANARTTATTVAVRKNGADGNLNISIGSGATGAFEDTTNTDAIVAGDLINTRTTTGTGTGTITIELTSCFHDATSGADQMYAASNGTGSSLTSASSTGRSKIAGDIRALSVSETDAQLTEHAGTFSNLGVRVITNGRSTQTDVMLRKNAADTALVVQIGAGATGYIEDTTHSETFADGDLSSVRWTTGTGTGTLTFTALGVAKSIAGTIQNAAASGASTSSGSALAALVLAAAAAGASTSAGSAAADLVRAAAAAGASTSSGSAAAALVRAAAAAGASTSTGSAAPIIPTLVAAAAGGSTSSGSASPIIPNYQAAAAGASSSSGAAGAAIVRAASASGASTSAGSAAATLALAGAASGASTSSGSAAALIPTRVAAASGASSSSGSADGLATHPAAASGASTSTGTAAAALVRAAAASGSSTSTGSAAGLIPAYQAAAAGASASSGSATATAPALNAAASGASSTSGTATGAMVRAAAASGASSTAGSAAPLLRLAGDAIGSSTSAGTASPLIPARVGAAAGASTSAGTASPLIPVRLAAASGRSASGLGPRNIVRNPTGAAGLDNVAIIQSPAGRLTLAAVLVADGPLGVPAYVYRLANTNQASGWAVFLADLGKLIGAGEQWTVSLYARRLGAAAGGATLAILPQNGTPVIFGADGTITPTNAWQRFQVTSTATADASAAHKLYAAIPNLTETYEYAYIQVELGATATTPDLGGATADAAIVRAAAAAGASSSSGSAAATVPARQAAAAGASTSSGTAAARLLYAAAAAGAATSSGSATAAMVRAALASGASTTGGSAGALVLRSASAAGSTSSAGAASGTVLRSAAATGASTTAGAALGGIVSNAAAEGASITAGVALAVVVLHAFASGTSTSRGRAWVIGAGDYLLAAAELTDPRLAAILSAALAAAELTPNAVTARLDPEPTILAALTDTVVSSKT